MRCAYICESRLTRRLYRRQKADLALAKAVYLIEVLGSKLRVGDPQTLGGCQTQDAYLALMNCFVDWTVGQGDPWAELNGLGPNVACCRGLAGVDAIR